MGKYVGGKPSAGLPAPVTEVEDDGLVSSQFPALWEYLTMLHWDDGSARMSSTILLFVEDGIWKACFNDRALGRTAWAAGDTILELLTALERALVSGTVVWRRRPADAPKGRGKG